MSLLAPAQAKQPAPEPKKPLPAPKKGVKPEPDLCSRITVHLGNRHRDRPKQKKALLSYLRSMFRPATDEQILEVVEKLEAAGHIRFGEKDAVVYDFKAKQDELALS